MSLISLNSRTEDPAEFTNFLSNNLRLPPNTKVRCLGYGINIDGYAGNKNDDVIISEANDTFVLLFGDDDDTMDLPNVVVKIPHGVYNGDGIDLCDVMSKEANLMISGGIIPGFCGANDLEAEGIRFEMDAGSIKLTVFQQTPARPKEGLYQQYNVPEFTYDEGDPLGPKKRNNQTPATIANGGGATAIEVPCDTSTYTACYNRNFNYFPCVPRLNGGIPDKTQFNALVDACTSWGFGAGGGPGSITNEQMALQCGGICPVTNLSQSIAKFGQGKGEDLPPGPYQAFGDLGYATGSLERGYNPNMDFNGIQGTDFKPFHGWEIIPSTDLASGLPSLKLMILRGEFNEFGSVGSVTYKKPDAAIFDIDIDWGQAWQFTIYQRIVANNDPAVSSKATGYVSQIWVATSGINGGPAVAATLCDEYDITKFRPVMKQGGIRSVWKAKVPKGTGLAGDIMACKIAETPGNSIGNAVPGGPFPQWDGSVQTNTWTLFDRVSYDNVGAGAIMQDEDNTIIYNMSQQCNASSVLGFENPSVAKLVYGGLASTVNGVKAGASLSAANSPNEQWDTGQTFLIQLPGLPINGKLGATGDDAQIVAWGRLKSVYNGDTEAGAYWYMYPRPAEIRLDNSVELQLNQLNVRLTDEWGQKIKGLDKYTSILLEFTPDPPDGAVNPYR